MKAEEIVRPGPGACLHHLLLGAWLPACADCTALAARMDRRGVAWCRTNAGTLADALLRNAGAGWVPFGRRVALRLVLLACARAEGVGD